MKPAAILPAICASQSFIAILMLMPPAISARYAPSCFRLSTFDRARVKPRVRRKERASSMSLWR